MTDLSTRSPVGSLLREWRERRRFSQLALALEVGISARHLSFVETGRARPSRDVVLRLARHLGVPLRDRNALLLAAGFAPEFTARPLDEGEMSPVREALETILAGYEPHPALAVDRGWHLVAANAGMALFTGGLPAELLAPPVNVLRLSLHPRGLAPAIGNLGQWRGHLLERLAREAALTADPALAELHRELLDYPGGVEPAPPTALAVPLRLRVAGVELSFLSAVTTFGTAIDVTVAELSVEAFLPADGVTARYLGRRTRPEHDSAGRPGGTAG